MENVMTPLAQRILSQVGDLEGFRIHLMEIVTESVLPDWERILRATQVGETRERLRNLFREVLKTTGLEQLLYSNTMLYIMPDERDRLQKMELWEWFSSIVTIKVVGEDATD